MNLRNELRYTEAQLKAAFEKVEDKEHWKNPIKATVSLTKEEIDITTEAVIYYTGSVPNFLKRKNGKYYVTALGYYAVIGA